MTTDEFERILVALSHMGCLNINGQIMVPLEGVIKVVHSNLHSDDRSLYEFDFKNYKWIKKQAGSPNEPKGGEPGTGP